MADDVFPNPEDRFGLPGWTYFNDELFALESETLFRRHWQIVCHSNDILEKGQFTTFDLVGERALIIRGEDGVIRAFHNLCRHRGSRVVTEENGICKNAMVCPFHGWSFNLDGTLRSPARPRTLPDLDPVEWGLKPIECEIWQGFIFIRFKPGHQPSVKEIMAPHDALIQPQQLADLVPATAPFKSEIWNVNWKAIRDVDNEGYHVPIAHPGLQDLYGKDYQDYNLTGDTALSVGNFNPSPSYMWSTRNYRNLVQHLPEPWASLPKAWHYILLFPNQVIGLYPDSVIFYQDIPLTTGTSIQRSASYARPNEDRVTRATRHLAARIDAITGIEDMHLIEWSYEAMKSSAFDGIMLSELESGVGQYHHRLKSMFPVMNCADEPAPQMVKVTNDNMSGAKMSGSNINGAEHPVR